MGVVLAGGWGYNNLGDEAILAGYVETLLGHDLDPTIISVDPRKTRAAQRRGIPQRELAPRSRE
jgi:polysaccharide pyruvyl transferase WcaK-like protein